MGSADGHLPLIAMGNFVLRWLSPLSRPVIALILGAILLAAVPASFVIAQTPADCGVVTEIGYPVENISGRSDDFGLYRGRFGGLHTGVDLAFYRYGDPVYAVADGRVTYADPEGWDTEKGVVIVEHTFPDGSVFYSLYGHMEPIGDYFFPGVGQCVRKGNIVGAIGDPSLSAPHLHFEIRDFGPDDGGPGYWPVNPQEAGWEHPLDFIARWQLRLQTASDRSPYVTSVTGLIAPGVPPLVTEDGGLVMARARVVEGIGPEGVLRWRMELSSAVAGMILLPDGRILTRTADGTILLMRDGRYIGLWTPDWKPVSGPYWLDDVVVFVTEDGALAGYTPEGILRWLAPLAEGQPGSVAVSADGRLAVSIRLSTPEAAPSWHVVAADGRVLYQVAAPATPYATFSPAGDAYLLAGDQLYHISAGYVPVPLARLPQAAGRSVALAADSAGNVYVFMALDQGVLYAYAPDGTLRWQAILPGEHRQPPLLAVGRDCLLYALAADGTLYAISATDGATLGQARLYAGGAAGHPNARLLEILPGPAEEGERVRFGTGFLTVATIDGHLLAGLAPAACPAPAA